jgi:hypothetical protein
LSLMHSPAYRYKLNRFLYEGKQLCDQNRYPKIMLWQ